MRSDDSRAVRRTVHLTAREFNLLEIARSDWKEPGGGLTPVRSRAELRLRLVDWLMLDEPTIAALPGSPPRRSRRDATGTGRPTTASAAAGSHGPTCMGRERTSCSRQECRGCSSAVGGMPMAERLSPRGRQTQGRQWHDIPLSVSKRVGAGTSRDVRVRVRRRERLSAAHRRFHAVYARSRLYRAS